jgi:hypothetical protein
MPTQISAPSVISPWIRELIGGGSRVSRYFLCENCECGFFTKRYDSDEINSIYKDYRGPKYLEIRTKWESWYSTSYNTNHDDKDWILSRVNSLTKFLAPEDKQLNVVIDVGGDRGQYIPDIAKNRIVFDLSHKETLPGIVRISEFNHLPQADLIIYAHVLEHVADPVLELRGLFLKSKRIYVEVPYGVPVINNFRTSKFNFFRYWILSHNKKLWSSYSAPATGREVPANKVLTQSEHLTFFSEKSTQVLANRLGATLRMEKSRIKTPDGNTGLVLQCMFSIAH